MLNIFYRLCEKEEGTHCDGRPEWFSKMNCLNSFLLACEYGSKSINKLIFIHDGPKGKLYNYLQNCPTLNNPNIVKIEEGNYYGSLLRTYELANDCDDGDFYFVEDDYLHLPDSIEKIDMCIRELGLISPYDHLACYDPEKYIGQPRHMHENKEVELNNHTWKINEFACHTYAISQELFNSKKDTIQSEHCTRSDINLFRTMYSQGYPLWVPIPALATQVDTYMSPGVDWEEFNKSL